MHIITTNLNLQPLCPEERPEHRPNSQASILNVLSTSKRTELIFLLPE